LSGKAYAESIADLESRFKDLLLVGVDLELARVAGIKAELFGLRGYDAVHLASALGLGGEETTLITWDKGLAGAAASTGLAVAGAPSG
jgi:predicted nucleic acid-binding protein